MDDYINKILGNLNISFDKNKKTICIGYDNWIIGGVEKVLLTLMNHLVFDYNIIMILPELDNKKASFPIPDSIGVIRLNDSIAPYDELCVACCTRLKVDLFVGNANLNCKQLTIYKKLKEAGIKSIMLNHYFWLFPCWHEILYSKEIVTRNNCLQYPDAIACLTNVSSKICSLNANRTICVMPNPNFFEVQPSISYEERENVIVTVGRYDDRLKRLDKILKIFSQVHKEDKNIKLIVVGPVYYEETFGKSLEQELIDLSLPVESVEFVGPQSDVSKYYKKARAFLFATEFEGFGLVLNEAACFGLPIVTSYFLGVEDLVEYDKNGYFYKEESDAKKHLLEILHDTEKWNEMSQYCNEKAKTFSKEFLIQRWETLISLVLNNEDAESLLYKNGLACEKQLTYLEYEGIIKEYEKIVEEASQRINRADAAQDFLSNSLEQERKLYSNPTFKHLIKVFIKKIFRIH